ncbi:MAG: hypothetical protein ACLT98_02880 [Eggerthellaceae bacterium]
MRHSVDCRGQGKQPLGSDEGFEGAVVVLGAEFNACVFNEQTQTFSVGVDAVCRGLFARPSRAVARDSIRAVGTGTVGGALRMNAGTSTNTSEASLVDNLASSWARPQALQRLRRLVGLS